MLLSPFLDAMKCVMYFYVGAAFSLFSSSGTSPVSFHHLAPELACFPVPLSSMFVILFLISFLYKRGVSFLALLNFFEVFFCFRFSRHLSWLDSYGAHSISRKRRIIFPLSYLSSRHNHNRMESTKRVYRSIRNTSKEHYGRKARHARDRGKKEDDPIF